MDQSAGVVFPASGGGARSTSALGRAVVAGALRGVDPIGARAAEQETNWRRGYLVHFRRLVEAGMADPAAARRIAADGLATLHGQMRVELPAGSGEREIPLAGALRGGWEAGEPRQTATVTGDRPPERELTVPYRGERLRGAALHRQLEQWVTRGVVEPSCAEAVRAVADHPEWLDLSDVTVAVLGAGAEMGPTRALLRWGGEVAAVDLPSRAIWSRLLEYARRGAGTLRLPRRGEGGELAGQAGADLLRDTPAVAQWLAESDRRLVLGSYAYADGGTHVRLAAACDALAVELCDRRPDTALSFLATPTDVYVAPPEAVAHAHQVYRRRAALSRPVRWLSGGRLLRRNYPPGAEHAIIDCLVPQQGPNYALAKRVQRWRATLARSQQTTVSLTVAPMTRTRSVLKNRALAAAYAGAHTFGVEVFEPATSNTLMAALLVHDLRNPPAPAPHPWQEEAARAAHGGVWRVGYAPRSALGLAALIGLGGARH